MPDDFRFAVKVPREVTHIRKLVSAIEPFERLLAEVGPLGQKLGPLLVQLPPSLGFDEAVADAFFAAARVRFDGHVVCEPRHPTWFASAADGLLARFRAARVAADPPPVPEAATPGGWPGLAYRRLHGSPRVYYSAYSDLRLDMLAEAMAEPVERWCVFDNTTLGEATGDALRLIDRL